MQKKIIYIFLIITLVTDLSYSFLQYYNTPFDGDIAGGVIPADDVQKILDDPFGFNVITNNTTHPNPNRFFAHLFFKAYFQNVPLLLQNFVSPIESIYLSAAIIKLIVHIIILFCLSFFITKTFSVTKYDFILVAILLTTLFQAYGYTSLRIIDIATTYVFFYSLPLAIFLIMCVIIFPIIKNPKQKVKLLKIIVLFGFSIILPFNGPLIPPIILICSLVYFIYYTIFFIKRRKETKISVFKSFINELPTLLIIFFVFLNLLFGLFLQMQIKEN
jgi:hypothetical protein